MTFFKRNVGLPLLAAVLYYTVGFSAPSEPTAATDSKQDVQLGVCQGTTDYPHQSSHVPGTINVVGTTKCKYYMPIVGVTVFLEKGDFCLWTLCLVWNVVATGAYTGYFQRKVWANAAVPCKSGVYRGQSVHWYKDANGKYWASAYPSSSPNVQINC